MSKSQEIVVRGRSIREDIHGLVCLDDIWEAAGARAGADPYRWRQLRSTKRLEEELQKKLVIAALKEDKSNIPVAYAKRGRGNSGTYAHPILAAAYAGYLSPKLEIEVREVWLRYRKADAALADEILQRASPTDNEWVAVRALARARRVSFTDTLRDHGVAGRGYPDCTNAVYREILGGTAIQVRATRGLSKKDNLRDHLETNELAYVMAAEVLAKDRIEEEDRHGNYECEKATSRSASFIREAIERDKSDRQRPLVRRFENKN